MVQVGGLQGRIYILIFVQQASLIMRTHHLCILKVSVQPIPKIQVMHQVFDSATHSATVYKAATLFTSYIQMQVKCFAPHVESLAYHELLIQMLTGGGSSINVKILAVASSSMWCSRPLYYVLYHIAICIFIWYHGE